MYVWISCRKEFEGIEIGLGFLNRKMEIGKPVSGLF
jgi:hypothetical protein